ncbi:MAG TPA: GspH/FimT family pseudopilin [bacterium]|nr:GspH/FimT family pseudopilin [bacterium]
MREGARGVSALELLIAVAVGAVLVIVVAPALERYQRLRELRQGAQLLLAAVRLAQQQATTLDEEVRLVYAAGPPGRYTVETLGGAGLHHGELPAAVAVSGTFAATPLRFRPSGAPVAAGEFCLTEGTRWYRLDVSPQTGRAALGEVASCP